MAATPKTLLQQRLQHLLKEQKQSLRLNYFVDNEHIPGIIRTKNLISRRKFFGSQLLKLDQSSESRVNHITAAPASS
ncbi:hypothetical protein PCASD_08252 [Puccinia coronata f. sp. avenae]|uniref:Uncharacterized protein n=1 Tax=Puccinia coronata f. sp. avenae TaxID=200324 RepID=A0A2N5ULL9_9BASI|nr:hypothetical protein PCASD_08252 [Puccinia coronata f. sp. avenae]